MDSETYHSRWNPVYENQPPQLLRCILHIVHRTRLARALVLVQDLGE